MEFIITYLLKNSLEEGIQVDISTFDNEESCIEYYNSGEYEILEIREYDEEQIEKEMYEELEEDINYFEDEDNEDDEYNEEDGEDNLFVLFPNVTSQEELEEELYHSFTRMMDN